MRLKPTPSFYSILLLLLLWQGLAMVVDYPALFPSVTGLIIELFSMVTDTTFYIALWHTMLRGISGFLIALILSSTMAAIALQHAFWKSFFHPLIVITRSIPVISIVLIALLWLSPPGLAVFIAFFTMFPVLYQNILSGLEHTDFRLVEMTRVCQKNNLQRLLYIYLPSARDYIFPGMATAMGFGWRAVIIGEVLAGPVHGIGTSMKRAQAFIEMRELLAWTVVAIIISFMFDMLLNSLAKKRPNFKININKNISEKKILNADLKEINISLLNISFNNIKVISDYSVRLNNKHINLLKSASGSGKTTLFKILSGILKKESGDISFTPSEPVISYSFQDKRLIPWFNTEQNVAFSLPSFPTLTHEEKKTLDALVNWLELNEHKGKLPNELSGGEQQRVALARALMQPCHILLLDEPLTGLDQSLKVKIIRGIETFTHQQKPLIVWATHEEVEGYLEAPVCNV